MFVSLKTQWLGHPAGEKIELADDEAKLLISKGVAEEIPANDAVNKLVSQTFEAAAKAAGEQLQKAVESALQEFAKAQSLSRKGRELRLFGGGEPADTQKTFGHFLLAVRLGDQKALEEMGSKFVQWDASQKSTLVTQQGSLGGFAVPDQFYDQIMMLVAENAIVRPRAFVLTQSGRTTHIPMLDQATAPAAGDTAFLGGFTLAWTEEGATINEDNPLLKQAELNNYELSGYVPVSNTLSQDFPGLEGFLQKLFATAVAWYEDYAFLRGNGVGKPLGAQTWAGYVSVTRSAASAFSLADYAGVMARWLGDYNPRTCCWVAHPTVLAKLIAMTSGSAGFPLFIDNARERPKMMLGGLTLEVSEKVPALNTAGDIALYDFSKYVVGDRRQMEVAFSPHYLFNKNQTAWRVVSRVGGMPWMKDKITLSDASNTLSPFVGLAAG